MGVPIDVWGRHAARLELGAAEGASAATTTRTVSTPRSVTERPAAASAAAKAGLLFFCAAERPILGAG